MKTIQEISALIDTENRVFDDDGREQIAEIERFPLLGSDPRQVHGLLDGLGWLGGSMGIGQYSQQVILAAFKLITNASAMAYRENDIAAVKVAMTDPDLVFFKNGAVLLLPPKEHEAERFWSFNPGWVEPTLTDAKTIMTASACYVVNNLVWKLADAKDHTNLLEEVNASYYAIKDVGLSNNCDGPRFAQLID